MFVHDAGRMEKQLSPRVAAMAALYRDGSTFEEVAGSFGVSKQAVHKNLKRAGLSRVEGGAHLGALAAQATRREAQRAQREARIKRCWGITVEEWMRHTRSGLLMAYQGQRQSARQRGIGWEITTRQWLEVWNESGKLRLRGCERGKFVMSRRGDEGPYAIGNVFIQTHSDNIREGFANRALKPWPRVDFDRLSVLITA